MTIKMCKRIGNKKIKCPYPECELEFPISGNVSLELFPKGAGGCKRYATCPHCKKDSCYESDSKKNEMELGL
jgi:hypothetical protein|tara:strand:+ start:10086 stop:10301 length:216 start_codon:yes stop_codon:yes gene_type:complete